MSVAIAAGTTREESRALPENGADPERMRGATSSNRCAVPPEPVLQLTVEQYHEMTGAGILVEGDPIELLEGWLVRKVTKYPPHMLSAGCTLDALAAVVGTPWHVRAEGPIVTRDSEPEPDVSVVRGQRRDYARRHPGPEDVALLVEVADTSLERDRGWKKRIYAAAEIPVYWIVNLADRQVEVFAGPSGPGDEPDYGTRQVFLPGDQVPVVLDGNEVGRIAVDDLLP
jgi:Uma2 family endonuclease